MSEQPPPTSSTGEATAGYWSNRIHVELTGREVIVTGTRANGDPPQIREALKDPRLKFLWNKERQAWVYDRTPARLGDAADAIRQVLTDLDQQATPDGVVTADRPNREQTPPPQDPGPRQTDLVPEPALPSEPPPATPAPALDATGPAPGPPGRPPTAAPPSIEDSPTPPSAARPGGHEPAEEFDFWRDVIGEDLVVDGVVYDSQEWTRDGEGGVRRLTEDERAGREFQEPEPEPAGIHPDEAEDMMGQSAAGDVNPTATRRPTGIETGGDRPDRARAAGALFESLQTQAESAGYLVTVWPAEQPHTKPVEVDHEAQTVDVFDDGAYSDAEILNELTSAVAAIQAEAETSGADLQQGFEDVIALFAERGDRDLDNDDPIPTGPYASTSADRTVRAFARLQQLVADDQSDINDVIDAINAAAGTAAEDAPADGRTRGPALPPELEMLYRELRDAHTNSSWYHTTPQWQQIKAITAALKELGDALKAAPGRYLHEVARDIRARGFMRAVTARVSRLIAKSCRAIATGMETIGLGNTPGWLAIQALHTRAADFSDQLMGALPPGWTLQTLDGLRQNWNTLRTRLARAIPTRQTETPITASAIAGLRTALAAAAGQASGTRAWQRLSDVWDRALPVLGQVHQGTLRFENDAKGLGLLTTTWTRTCELASFTARRGMDRLEAGDTSGTPGPGWHALRLLRHAAEQNIAHLRDELAAGEHAPLGTYDRQTAGRGGPHLTGEPAEQTTAPPTLSPASTAAEPPAQGAVQPAEAEPPPLDRNWVATEYLAGRPPRDAQAERLYRQFASELTRTNDPAVLGPLNARLNAYDGYDGPMTWTQWNTDRVADAPSAAPGPAPSAGTATRPNSQARRTAAQSKAGFPQPVREQLRAAGARIATSDLLAAAAPTPPSAGPITAMSRESER